MSHFEGLGELNPIQRKEYNEGFERTISIKAEIKESEQKRKDIAEFLKTKGDGEIRITNKIYPNCSLHVNGHRVDITSETHAITYYVQDGELKQIT